MRCGAMVVILASLLISPAIAADGAARPTATTLPSTVPAGRKLPFIQVDIAHKTLRVECRTVKAEYPLEFYCVVANTYEYEAVLSSQVKPSNLHLALLMLGLQPGKSLQYSKATDSLTPPKGPELRLSVEWVKDARLVRYPANQLLRSIKTKQPAPAMTWCFAGSRIIKGAYMADVTGYLVSVVNVDGMVIDLPKPSSRAMDDREWEPNWELMPETGTQVWLVIEPTGK